MKRSSVGAALLAAVTIGCSDSTGPATPADLVGTWVATAYVFTNTSNTAQSVDVIAMGMTFSLTFTETTMSGTITIPNVGTERFEGTYTISGNQITISDPEGTETLTHSLNGNILTLTSTETFDFNDDGQETPATSVITLQKQ